jgi:hypothetical protein
MDYAGL